VELPDRGAPVPVAPPLGEEVCEHDGEPFLDMTAVQVVVTAVLLSTGKVRLSVALVERIRCV
jgi:hypothetical protein